MSQEVSIQSLGKRQRLLEWSQRVAECRQSGMSVTRWCQEHSITPKTYYTWQKRAFAFMVDNRQIFRRKQNAAIRPCCGAA